MIASTFFCLTNIFHLVPISWELYWTFWSLQSEGDTKIDMPDWVHLIYIISFFLAILPPASYAYIFSPPNFLLEICKAGTEDHAPLIDEESIQEEINVESTHL